VKNKHTWGGARRGAGRPKGRKMMSGSISMPAHLWVRLDIVRGHLSRSAAIRRLIMDAGDDLMESLQQERNMRIAAHQAELDV
jgi:metal-responsive CopG/Arc/MetJ family transcriptional regulator